MPQEVEESKETPRRGGTERGRGQPARNGRPPAAGPVFGALDLGTNNCRLLVARPQGQGFRVVDAFSRIVRLGEGISATGRLSEAAVERAIEALKICARKMQHRGVTHMRNVATEACRQAANGEDFVARVARETGLALDIIPPAEEARLSVLGCQALLDPACRRAIVFDIGGGSTEMTWIATNRGAAPKILGWTSVPFGVVSLSEMFEAADRVTPETYAKMRGIIRARLEPFDRRYNLTPAIAKGGIQMLGTSGTVTTLTSLSMGLTRYDRSRVDGAWVTTERLLQLCRELSDMDHAARAAQSCIGVDRAELIVAGCAILETILELWAVPRLRVADRGIREGLLLELMSAVRLSAVGDKNGRRHNGWRRGRPRRSHD